MAEKDPVIDSEESAKNLAKHILSAEQSSRDFVENFKDALSVSKQLNKAMEKAFDGISKNNEKIEKNNKILAQIGKGIESNLAKQATIEASINQYKKEQNKLSSDLWLAEEKKLDLSKQLLAIESEMDDVQMRAIHNEEDLSEEYSKMMQVREKIMQDQIKNATTVASLTRKMQINEKQTNEEIDKRNKLGEAYNKLVQRKNKLESDNSGLQSATDLLKSQIILIKLIQMGYDRFVKLDKAAEDFRRQTGFSNTQMVELRKNAESINLEFQDMGVGINEVYASAKALTDVFGRTSLVSKEAMQNVSLMSANLGVAAEDSANVLATFQGLGGASQDVAMNVMKVGASLSEKAGVPFSLVMKDIANASSETLAMIGANPSKLMKSAIAARAMGTSMNAIVASQRKLLDFSSSINDELETSALLGKSISFQKARQLAYDGDIAGAAKATLETVKAAGDFESMSVYQREALAKASGMELKDLTKMMAVDKQREEIELRGTDEQKAQLKMQTEALEKLEKENDLSKEGLLAEGEKAIRQQKMQGQMTKLKNIMDSLLVSIGDILEPIITLVSVAIVPAFGIVAKILKFMLEPISWIGKGISFIFDSTTSLSKASKSVGEQFKDWKTTLITLLITLSKIAGAGLLTTIFFGKVGVGGLMKTITSPLKMVKDVGKNLIGKLTGKGPEAAGDAVGKTAKSTENVKSGTGVKDFLTNLATGLKEMGSGKVLLGAFNLIPASIGLIAMIPGFLGAKLLENIDGKTLKKALEGLANGLESMGTGSVAKGALVMILAGVAFAAMTVGAIGLGAVALLGEAAGAGLVGLSIGLSALGNPVAGLGVLILMGISAAFIGFAYAGKLAAEAFTSIAAVIPDAIGPFIKFALISPLLYAAAGAISALSISLALFAGASVGGKLASFFTGDPFEKFQKLADLSERLKMSADAMKDISIAAASFTSINAFADSISKLADSLGKLNDQLGAIKSDELSKLSQVASATNSSNTIAPVAATTLNTSGIEAKLDTLTNLLTGGAVRVYLDGKDVSAAMTGIGR
jgi:hypothetical protein